MWNRKTQQVTKIFYSEVLIEYGNEKAIYRKTVNGLFYIFLGTSRNV